MSPEQKKFNNARFLNYWYAMLRAFGLVRITTYKGVLTRDQREAVIKKLERLHKAVGLFIEFMKGELDAMERMAPLPAEAGRVFLVERNVSEGEARGAGSGSETKETTEDYIERIRQERSQY